MLGSDNMTAYFNHAATSFPKPEEVYLAMDHHIRNSSGSFARSTTGVNQSLWSETRELICELLDCPSKKVVFTPTATESINIILQGIDLKEGAKVYISPFEHNAEMRVLHHLKERSNIEICILAVHVEHLSYDLDLIQKQFEKIPPDLVVLSHASNVCGLIAPMKEICTYAKEYSAITVVDLCQTAGLLEISLNSNIYDFGIFAGHKTLYAPYGISGFVTSDRIPVNPLLYGGTGADSANKTVPSTTPERFEVGSQNSHAVAGLNASLHWILEKTTAEIRKKEQSDRDKLVKLLRNYPFIRLIGHRPEQEQIGILSTIFQGLPCENVGMILREQGIEVRTGLHCSPLAHQFLGTFPEGTVRFSCGYFQTEGDFKMLERGLNYIAENLE